MAQARGAVFQDPQTGRTARCQHAARAPRPRPRTERRTRQPAPASCASSSWPRTAAFGSRAGLCAQRGDAGQFFSFYIFERGATAGRDVRHAIGKPELVRGRGRISAADERLSTGIDDRLAYAFRAGRKRFIFEDAHRPVPEHRLGLEDHKTEIDCSVRSDVENHVIWPNTAYWHL